MAETNQRVEELVFRSRVEGAEQAARALDGLKASTIGATEASTRMAKDQAAAMATVARQQAAVAKEVAAAQKSMGIGFSADGVTITERQGKMLGLTTRELERLQRALDPAYRDMARLAEAQTKLTRAAETGQITWQRQNELMLIAQDRFRSTGKEVETANDNIKLSSGQLQGLGYQVNDIGTMLAMGASPFQVMASQAGQVVQVLGEHPGGVRGSLKAAGAAVVGFAAGLGPVGLGIAGAAAAVAGLAYALREDFPDAAETLERHSAVLAKVTAQYDDLKEQLEKIGEAEEAISLRIDLEIDRKNIERQLKDAMRDADIDFTSTLGQIAFGAIDFADAPTRGAFDPIREEVDAFREALKRGEEEAVIPFREKLAYLYEIAGNDQAMRSAIEAAMTYTDTLAGLTVKADEAATALERMGIAEKGGRLRITGRDQEADLMARMNPDGADDIRQALEAQAAALTKTTTKRREAKTEAEKYADAIGRIQREGQEEIERLEMELGLIGQNEAAAECCLAEFADLSTARQEARP